MNELCTSATAGLLMQAGKSDRHLITEDGMITIKHRFTGADLCEFDVETVRDAVVKAVADNAYLDGANLRGANLDGANLVGANLDGEKLTKAPISILNLRYTGLISDGYMRLGCKRFTHDEWANFTDDEISDMDRGALEFWKQWKAPLLAMCAAHAPIAEQVTA